MKQLVKMLMLVAGVLLMVYAFMPSGGKADVLDMGGCSGAGYPCIPVTVWGTVHWTGAQEVTSLVMNVRIPTGGYSNIVYADSDGTYRFDNVPAWDEIAAPYHHYEGSVDVVIDGHVVASQSYWRTISGGTTHSSNWVTGDSYALDFTVQTGGQNPNEPEPENPPTQTETNTIIQTAEQPRWAFFFIGLLLFVLAVVRW